ncbi:hypothetical protein BOTBODRAFT_192956 [Botryobasidium botryosum FD-172 SS1]|uniref:Uncharacterized protein n=1 Tax=Botryobasidium botryosum (strain FD-172 SS1) TaxID=930990 RepID=A0A067M3Z7_BOTB1|nr:hypothetical protein BOTBODRAFT_192956 [Botryobasidium botryosum FD-172 SS1]
MAVINPSFAFLWLPYRFSLACRVFVLLAPASLSWHTSLAICPRGSRLTAPTLVASILLLHPPGFPTPILVVAAPTGSHLRLPYSPPQVPSPVFTTDNTRSRGARSPFPVLAAHNSQPCDSRFPFSRLLSELAI